MKLTEQQVASFVQDGVLVVEDIIDAEELSCAIGGLHQTLLQHAIDPSDLEATGRNLRHLSSTNGSGGVLDLFYDSWKLKIVATNEKLFHVTTQLWEAAYCHDSEQLDDLAEDERFKWHPNGAFDCRKGYLYIDRIGYRIPTKLAQELGRTDCCSSENGTSAGSASEACPDASGQPRLTKSSKKKAAPIQRSLTPHLDCCPTTFHANDKTKWRPIQCFVALTDALEANQGGFEAAPGFHREFEGWTQSRAPTRIVASTKSSSSASPSSSPLPQPIVTEMPAPCVGEYTHIRPVEDRDVMARIHHIPVRAGSAVFWDNRIPHANSYRHDGSTPRAVVYCSFLPDIALNRHYCQQQLANWRAGRNPTDQWIQQPKQSPLVTGNEVHIEPAAIEDVNREREDIIQDALVTPLARRLAGLETWE